MSKTIGVADVKKNFSAVINEVSLKGEHFIIEKKGKPMVAMVSIKELEHFEDAQKKGEKKGLLSAIGAWEDFDNLEQVISDIYRKRSKAKDRTIEEFV